MHCVTAGEGQGEVTFNLCVSVGRCASALSVKQRLSVIPEIPEISGFLSRHSCLAASGSCLRTLFLQGGPS